jgi:hypothetical protein
MPFCCGGKNLVLPLPQHGELDLYPDDVGGEQLSEEILRDFGPPAPAPSPRRNQ